MVKTRKVSRKGNPENDLQKAIGANQWENPLGKHILGKKPTDTTDGYKLIVILESCGHTIKYLV